MTKFPMKTNGVAESLVKITPAMRRWCTRLKSSEMCTLTRSPKTGMISVVGAASWAKPTYTMVDRLEEAGLIIFITQGGMEVASLTRRGFVAMR